MFGPVHAYVAPVTAGVKSAMVAPSQYGPPLLAVGVAGIALTTTFVVPAAEVQPFTVIVTEYVPASAIVALARVGFCCAEMKPFGPLHEYVAPETNAVESEIVAPSQYGPSLLAAGVAGVAFTMTLVVPAAEVQPFTVTVTEYVPASAVVALARVGFCCAEIKPFGPVHEYVAPVTNAVESEIVVPSQYGPPLLALGVAGIELTTTFVVPAAEVQPFTVMVTEYVPPSAIVAFARVGFCCAEMKPFGPVHAYVAPETNAVESEIVAPSQYGPPFEAAGVAGIALTTTLVVPATEVQPLTVIVTEYVPASAIVALERVGFCCAEMKPFGPAHEYVAPLTNAVESEIVAPSQYGPPFDAAGVAGIALTTTLVVPAAEVQPFTVIVTEYVPASAVVAFARVGFCCAEMKPFGPLHEYVAPETNAVDSEIVAPAQYGPPFDAVGVAGVALTTTSVVPAAEGQPSTVIVTEYVPASAVVALGRVGFWSVEVKPFGPLHAYVAPLTVGVESEIVAPAQYGPPFDAVGVAGDGLTTTSVVPAAELQPFTVTITEYVPASASAAFGRAGFWSVEVKPFGPLHAYVAPVTAGVKSAMVAPSQYGPPLVAVGVAGMALTTTLVVPAAEVQPLTVIVTEYVPLSAVVALAFVGFCCAEMKPFGPLHEYVAPETNAVESEIVAPSQYGPSLPAAGVAGVGLTTTLVVPAAEVQPLTVMVTE